MLTCNNLAFGFYELKLGVNMRYDVINYLFPAIKVFVLTDSVMNPLENVMLINPYLSLSCADDCELYSRHSYKLFVVIIELLSTISAYKQ